jgi:Ca2+-binding EF-hand superfamily protein
MEIRSEDKKKIANAYRAFFAELMQSRESGSLSDEELKAIGQKLIDDLIERSFANFSLSKEEKEKIRREFLTIISEECKEESLCSTLTYDKDRSTFYKSDV